MKSLPIFLTLSMVLVVPALAELPQKKAVGSYSTLWTNSPFTTPAPPPPPPDQINPLSNYALSAVSPVEGGYMVTIQNKTKPDDRVTIPPEGRDGFKIEKVTPGQDGMRSMTVTLRSGSSSGVVSFDDRLLTIKPPTPVKQGGPGGQGGPGNHNNPGGPGNNPMPQQNGAPVVMNQGAPTAVPNGGAGGGNSGNQASTSGFNRDRGDRGGRDSSGGGRESREGRGSSSFGNSGSTNTNGNSGRMPRPRVVPGSTR